MAGTRTMVELEVMVEDGCGGGPWAQANLANGAKRTIVTKTAARRSFIIG
jgi:hypothetical protein